MREKFASNKERRGNRYKRKDMRKEGEKENKREEKGEIKGKKLINLGYVRALYHILEILSLKFAVFSGKL